MILNEFSLLLMDAQEAAPKGDSSNIFSILLPPLAIILVLYFMMDGPQRRERKKRDQMLKNLKKDDRVVTIGGIIGSVANISQDGKEVTVKVDEGTRIRFRRSAISEVLSGDTPAEPAKTA
jgi:preprotein translocase subunit YajC